MFDTMQVPLADVLSLSDTTFFAKATQTLVRVDEQVRRNLPYYLCMPAWISLLCIRVLVAFETPPYEREGW